MRKFIGAILASLTIMLAAGACQPGLPPPATPLPNAGVLVVGDSITWQASIGIQVAHPDWELATYMGWKMSDVRERIIQRRGDGSLGTIVVALGTNDANPTWNGGWTAEDENLWADTLLNLHPNTDIVLVKPKITAPADPVHIAEVEEARAWMDRLAALSPSIYEVDWADFMYGEHVMYTDGIHLDFVDDAFYGTTPEAVAARLLVLESRREEVVTDPAADAVVEVLEEAVQEAA